VYFQRAEHKLGERENRMGARSWGMGVGRGDRQARWQERFPIQKVKGTG
jgi:hypothetical protein